MKIELKHLKQYLGCNLGIRNIANPDTFELSTLNIDLPLFDNEYYKPILRPLNLREIGRFKIDICNEKEINEFACGFITLSDVHYSSILIMAENHIDMHRLINEGLAIYINTLTK